MANKQPLPPALVPFVGRALRGPRKRLYMAAAAAIFMLNLLAGLWIAMSSTHAGNQIRHDLGREMHTSDIERRDSVVFAYSALEYSQAQQWVRQHGEDGYWPDSDIEYRLDAQHQEAINALWSVAIDPGHDRPHRSRSDRARERLREMTSAPLTEDRFGELYSELETWGYVSIDGTVVPEVELHGNASSYWNSDYPETTVQRALNAQYEPDVVIYESPLGLRHALIFAGMLAAFELGFLLLMLGPVAVAVVQAQEVHENTLMPLSNAALRPRELAIGLAGGALAPVVIGAVPLAGMMLLGSALDGSIHLGILQLLVVAMGAVSLAAGAQLIGHLLGRRRSAGVVAVLMVGLSGVLFFAGSASGMSLNPDQMELAALSPQSAFALLTGATFGLGHIHAGLLESGWMIVGAAALLVLGGLAMRVTEHKIAGHASAPLGRAHAIVGAAVAVGWVVGSVRCATTNVTQDADSLIYVATLVLLCPIFGVLLMGRVPQSALPKMRKVALGALLGEILAWGGLHALLVAMVAPHPSELFSPVAFLYAAYVLAVGGLVCVRVAAAPVRVLSAIGIAFAFPVLLMAGAHVVGWLVDPAGDIEHIFAASELGAGMGFAQLLTMIAVPTLLIRGIKKRVSA